ncbi:MAG: TonB-dependent receptor domain-containing protein, partial [Opitutaceae bacterium]
LDLERKFYTSDEDVYGLRGDVQWNLPDTLGIAGHLKTGAKFRGLKREYDYDEKEWDVSGDFPFAGYLYMNPYDAPFGNENLAVPYVPDAPRIHREALPANPEWFSEQFESNLEDSLVNDYTADEDTWAGYLMSNVKAGNFGVIFGGRYEYTSFSTTGFVLDGSADTIAGIDASTIDPLTVDERTVNTKQETRERSYNAFLPSVHLRYDFSQHLVGRISWGETYARPAIKDMVGSVFIVEETTDHDDDPATPDVVTGAAASVPNFNLPPQRSENFDVSLEYYTQNGGFFQLGYFHKDMTNYAWSETYTTQDFPGYEGVDVEVSTPIANTDAVNQGIELAAHVPLTFLPDPLRGFAVTASYTYTDSEALYYTGRVGPTVGHSKNIYNASLEYGWRWFYGRISYQYRSKFFENISISDFAEESEALQPEYQFLFDDAFMNPGTIDLELGFRLSPKATVFVNATNVTEKINGSRQGYFQYPEDAYPHQRRFTFGLKGSF